MPIIETTVLDCLYKDTFRALTYGEPIDRVRRQLKKYEEDEEYEKCHSIHQALKHYIENH